MELTVPLHNIHTEHIRLSSPSTGHKVHAHVSYSTPAVDMNSLSIIMPSLTIKSYELTTGQLSLTIPPALTRRLQAIQERIVQEVRANQASWFAGHRAKPGDDIYAGFQPMIDGNLLRLYCPIGAGATYDIHVFSNGTWSRGVKASDLEANTRIRIILRIQGVSFHDHPQGGWSGKFRLQHRVLGIFT
jgi:hypothetical protein